MEVDKVDEIRKLKNKIQNMDKDLIRVRNERNKLKVECADMTGEVRRMRKRMNADERNYKADKERMRKRMNGLVNERESNRVNPFGMHVPGMHVPGSL
jgi:regulator of replication initiation timing